MMERMHAVIPVAAHRARRNLFIVSSEYGLVLVVYDLLSLIDIDWSD